MFAPNPRQHEQKAIGEVRSRLRARFADRDPAEITGVVDRIAGAFATARVRDYIPVLVERISRDELAGRFAHP